MLLKSLSLMGIVAVALVTPLCGYWFSCGCAWPWNGFFMTCNVFSHRTPGPHCPWCIHPWSAVATLGTSIILGALVHRKSSSSGTNGEFGLRRLLLGLVAAVLVLAAGGWWTAVVTQHPSFLGFQMH